MNKFLVGLFLMLFIIPSVAFASWWNPFSWFNFWGFSKTEIISEEKQIETERTREEKIADLQKQIDELKKEESIVSSVPEKSKNLAEEENTKETEVKPKSEPINPGPVSSIKLSGTSRSVNWMINGYSKNGFKIVWSKNSMPTYPTREGDKYIYLSDSGSRSTTLDAFSGSGTYYVRVCEYLGGACGVYSNQIQVSL